MIDTKTQKLVDELNALWKKNGSKWSQEYEDKLYSLTEEEVELLSSSYFESEDVVFHWSNLKACY